jgi:hypothetical protein
MQFTRGWIVQEIGTSTPATLYWGDASIDWNTLAGVCERLKPYHRLRSTLGIKTSDISFLFRRFVEPDESTRHANRFNFVYELQRARHLHFSDDRDRVFAFLGHFSTRCLHSLGCGPVNVAADYTRTVEQVYVDVAVQLLTVDPAALCIVLASVQHPHHSLPVSHVTTNQPGLSLEAWPADRHKLPSWVPDWRLSAGILLAEPICPHYTHGNTTARLQIMDNFSLRVYGEQIDTIEASSRPLLAADFYVTKTLKRQPPTMIEQLWREICKKDDFNLDEKYLNDQTAFFAFMQTLANGSVQAAGHEGRPYHEVPDSFWLHMAANYAVETLGESPQVSEDIKSVALGGGREGSGEQWARWATSAADGRVFARSIKGYYVLGPAELEAGDVICALFGCKVPFCLRPVGKHYLLVGECYTHGLMKGEAMSMLARYERKEQVFDIL